MTGINLTPMIDIVFLLIVFFMTVSWITQTQELQVDLPEVARGGDPTVPVRITINLDDAGGLVVAGESRTLDELEAGIRQELDQVGRNPARLQILLRCDRNCPGASVNELIRTLEGLGIRQIRVSVVVSED